MSKERRTITLDPAADEYLGQEGVNASELVNKLVKNHYAAGGDELSMLDLREQQLESDVANLEARLETKREELEQIRDRKRSLKDEKDDRLDDAVDALAGRHGQLQASNPAVENWADKLGMPPEALVEEIQSRT